MSIFIPESQKKVTLSRTKHLSLLYDPKEIEKQIEANSAVIAYHVAIRKAAADIAEMRKVRVRHLAAARKIDNQIFLRYKASGVAQAYLSIVRRELHSKYVSQAVRASRKKMFNADPTAT